MWNEHTHITPGNHSKYPQRRSYIVQVWIFVCVGVWYHSLVSPTYYHRPYFSEKLVNFRFVQIFINWLFSYMRLEHRTPWFIDRNLIGLVIQFCMSKIVLFPYRNQRFWSLSLIVTIIHICARFHSVVLSGISQPQAK